MRRPRVRITVRTLMIFTLVIACGLSWIVQRIHYRRQVAQSVRRTGGGSIFYDWQLRDRRHNPAAKPQWPDWIVAMLGPDFFGEAQEVNIGRRGSDADMDYLGRLGGLKTLAVSAPLTDTGLAHVRGLTSLKRLLLEGTRITGAGLMSLNDLSGLEIFTLENSPIADADLAPLRSLTTLKRLRLTCPRLTDVGMIHLRGLVNLDSLDLSSTQVTSAGLAQFSEMTRLKRLFLGGTRVESLQPLGRLTGLTTLSLTRTPVSDEGLAPAAAYQQLKWLDLHGSAVTGSGLRHLAGLTRLNILNISDTRISDADALGLSGLTSVTELDLSGTEITDAALAHLSGLPSLNRVDLRRTRVTALGIEALRRARPQLQISR